MATNTKAFHGMRVQSLRLALLTTSMMAAASFAYANDAADPADAVAADEPVAEVVVTATKRNTKLQKTPMAISAVTGDTLAKVGAMTMDEYVKFVPSLKVSDDGPGRGRISLRGIQGTGEALVGVFYDEAPITGSVGVSSDAGGRNPDTTATDVERIEVLRGPQGTMYGGSTMGGAVRIIMKKPRQVYEGFVSGNYSSVDGGKANHQLSAMANVPLIEDKLAARVVMYEREQGGWIDNRYLDREDINKSTTKGGRLLLRYTPLDNLTIDAAAFVQSTDAVSNNNWNPAYGDYVQESKLLLPYEEDTKVYSLSANWDIGDYTITGSSSYFVAKSIYAADDTAYVASYRTPARCSAYLGVTCVAGTQQYTDYLAYVNSYYPAAIYYPDEVRNWTNEIRVSSNYSGPINFTAGVYYENRDQDTVGSDVLADEATGELIKPIKFIYHRYVDDHLEQKAIFGEVNYDVTDKLKVTLGGRYFEYEKSVGGETDVPWDLIGATYRPYYVRRTKEDGTLLKVNASYEFNDDIMAYVNVAEGYRPGGVNQTFGLPDALIPYESDSLTNYEAGIKTGWFDRTLYVNAALYMVKWENMQVSGRTPNGAFSFISNAGAAEVKGFELESTWTPLPGLTVSGNYSYNDAQLTEDQINSYVTAAGRKGDRITFIPKNKGAISADYSRPLTASLKGFVRGDVNYVGISYSELSTANVYRMKNPAYTLANLRAGFSPLDGNWEASVFVHNLFDHVAITRLTNSSTTPIGGSAVSALPRTVGVSLTKKF
ncbi:TonB-dependent receptor [Asticcacaulis sp. ZE23SCel15]|uniref:TonB-dependent receptor n=1 Tax=Asticcacaulis sp. ZE23SCel15 TaxID=3059027 RepID=UPI0026600CA3|nr:TonB-dependent receptor [Asticcacaulis sp. ZE23SCel15]WKL56062.1 TonB-dependent receptor [Asticcacaulis sp. ZE23SCel15]